MKKAKKIIKWAFVLVCLAGLIWTSFVQFTSKSLLEFDVFVSIKLLATILNTALMYRFINNRTKNKQETLIFSFVALATIVILLISKWYIAAIISACLILVTASLDYEKTIAFVKKHSKLIAIVAFLAYQLITGNITLITAIISIMAMLNIKKPVFEKITD